jgi:hypothetical protein
MEVLSPQQIDILEHRRGLYRPPRRQTVTEWCESNLRLSSRQTEYPGPFSTSIRPYIREPLECWKDSAISEVTLCWGSQTAKTTMLMAGLSWLIANDASPALWIMPTKSLARSFSKSRWRPLLDESPAMVGEFPVSVDDLTHLEQQFRGCTLTFIGSNSPADLSSRPIRILVADEIDKFADATEREADALELAEDRLKAFSSSKEFLTSTPTLSEGRIWQRFLAGDQRRYWIPCPHCKGSIQLLWKHVKWDEIKTEDRQWDYPAVRASARYECQGCGGRITDAEKVAAVRHGEWRPENTSALPGVRSYHLSSLYSPDRKCTWGHLAVKFLKATESFVGLQGFINGTLAEPWENQEGRANRVEIVSPADAEPLSESVTLLTADHQALAPYFWVVAREWDAQGNSRLRACYTCDDWDTLRRIQLALDIEDRHVTVDSRHNPEEVREACLRYGKVVHVTRGAHMHVGWTPWDGQKPQWRQIDESTNNASPYGLSNYGVPLTRRIPYTLHSFQFAGDFFLSLLARLRKGAERCGGRRWELIEFPCGPEVTGALRVDEETYRRHLDAKRYEPRPLRRRVVWEWVKRSSRWPDHLLDCEITQIAWAAMHRRIPVSADRDDDDRDHRGISE